MGTSVVKARKLPGIPAIQGIDPNLEKILRPMKERLERLGGELAGGSDRAVTVSTLADQFTTLPSGIIVPGGSYDPATDTTPPPAASGLQAAGAFANIITSWTPAVYRNHAYTEVWRSTTNILDPYDATTNPTGSTIKIGEAGGSVFTDKTASRGTTYYYWIRYVSQAGIKGGWNAGSGGGTQAALALIDGSNLDPSLFSGNKVSNPDAESGEAVDWVTDGGGTLGVTASGPHSGVYSFDLASTAAPAVSRAFAVEPGRTYRVGAAIKGKNGGGAAGLFIRINYKNAGPSDGFYVVAADRTGFSDVVSDEAVPASWAQYSTSFTAPAGAKYASIAIYNTTGGDDTGILFDDVEFVGQLVTEHLGANIITAGSGIIGNLAVDQAMMAYASIGDLQLDRASANKVRIVTADIVTGNITTALIQAAAITTEKVGDSQITFAKIGDAEVGTLKIAGAAVTAVGAANGPATNATVISISGDAAVFGSWTTLASVDLNLGATSSTKADKFYVSFGEMNFSVEDQGSSYSIVGMFFEIRVNVNSGTYTRTYTFYWHGYADSPYTNVWNLVGPADSYTSSTDGAVNSLLLGGLQWSTDNALTGTVNFKLECRLGCSSVASPPALIDVIYRSPQSTFYVTGAKR